MEKYDVSSYLNLVWETGKLIDSDPLIWLEWEISNITKNFEEIHWAIADTEGWENHKKGLLAKVFSKLVWTDEEFQYKSFEGKMNSLFSEFDLTFKSVSWVHEMYSSFWKWLKQEYVSLSTYIDNIDKDELSAKEMSRYGDYVSMQQTLKNVIWRVTISTECAENLVDKMESARPIFQILLSSCMIEVGWQRSISSWANMMNTINMTIAKLDNTLTDNLEKASQQVLHVSSTPILSNEHLRNNMLKIEQTFNSVKEQQEQYKNKLLSTWEQIQGDVMHVKAVENIAG